MKTDKAFLSFMIFLMVVGVYSFGHLAYACYRTDRFYYEQEKKAIRDYQLDKIGQVEMLKAMEFQDSLFAHIRKDVYEKKKRNGKCR